MRVALMQPYFFPYIGYFQLMAACDVFAVFDDAQYIDRGWVNRNRILIDHSPQWITMPVAAAPHELPILKREYLLDDRMAKRLPLRISGAYRHAPFFARTMQLVEEILAFTEGNVADFNINLLGMVAARLGIETPIVRTSAMDKDVSLTGGERRVLDICTRLGATTYINPIGGRGLYSGNNFAMLGIDLCFLSCRASAYPQFGNAHVPFLSIVDALMFNDIPTLRRMLDQYDVLASL